MWVIDVLLYWVVAVLSCIVCGKSLQWVVGATAAAIRPLQRSTRVQYKSVNTLINHGKLTKFKNKKNLLGCFTPMFGSNINKPKPKIFNSILNPTVGFVHNYPNIGWSQTAFFRECIVLMSEYTYSTSLNI